jgi:hypothetical protein
MKTAVYATLELEVQLIPVHNCAPGKPAAAALRLLSQAVDTPPKVVDDGE